MHSLVSWYIKTRYLIYRLTFACTCLSLKYSYAYLTFKNPCLENQLLEQNVFWKVEQRHLTLFNLPPRHSCLFHQTALLILLTIFLGGKIRCDFASNPRLERFDSQNIFSSAYYGNLLNWFELIWSRGYCFLVILCPLS